PLRVSQEFIHVGAEIGVLLLLFMLGLEYTGEQLKDNLRRGVGAGVIDLLVNFPPGAIAGLLMGWKPLAAVALAGITYVSSSGVIAKLLAELRLLNNPETRVVLSILVFEDLVMAVYLPIVAVLLVGGGLSKVLLSEIIAVTTVFFVLFVAVRYGQKLSEFAEHESDEII